MLNPFIIKVDFDKFFLERVLDTIKKSSFRIFL
jgi:hypothetical protein